MGSISNDRCRAGAEEHWSIAARRRLLRGEEAEQKEEAAMCRDDQIDRERAMLRCDCSSTIARRELS